MHLNDRVFATVINQKFISSRDKHKCPKLWASKFYRILNTMMRQTNIQKQYELFPHAVVFIKLYIEYFFEYGIYRNDIQALKIFRGITKEFDFQGSTIDDFGFISMTGTLSVAEDFAKRDGIILEFKTNHLPKDVPIVYITKDVVPYSNEDEYVLLPGKITFIENDKSAIYSMNNDMIRKYMSMNTSSKKAKGGGKRCHLTSYFIDDAKIDFRHKILVWYRAIERRPVDVLGHLRLPKTNKKINEEYVRAVNDIDREYERLPHFIPEFQDLRAIFQSSTTSDEEKDDASRRMLSYSAHMAVYCKDTDTILTFHSGIPKEFFAELFDMKRIPEVEKAIKETIKKYWFKYR